MCQVHNLFVDSYESMFGRRGATNTRDGLTTAVLMKQESRWLTAIYKARAPVGKHPPPARPGY